MKHCDVGFFPRRSSDKEVEKADCEIDRGCVSPKRYKKMSMAKHLRETEETRRRGWVRVHLLKGDWNLQIRGLPEKNTLFPSLLCS